MKIRRKITKDYDISIKIINQSTESVRQFTYLVAVSQAIMTIGLKLKTFLLLSEWPQ